MLIKAANALLANLRYYAYQEGQIGEIQSRIAEKMKQSGKSEWHKESRRNSLMYILRNAEKHTYEDF
jgi:hypothetical protein